MGFIALDSRPADFPRVSAAEQAARDAQAERIIAAELKTYDGDNPEAQAALGREYEQRFRRPAPVRRGFIPLAEDEGATHRGFIPLKSAEPEAPSVMPSARTLALNNPAAAVAETAANLGSQTIALPVAGLAGLATEAGRAIGLTDRTGADVVHVIGDALTYRPRGQLGQYLTEAAMYPFEKLAEAGQWAGGKTLDATGSPVAATAVDTTINALPMLIAPAAKGVKATREKFSQRSQNHVEAETARGAGTEAAEAGGQPEVAARGQGGGEGYAPAGRGHIPLEEVADTAPAAIPGRQASETGRGMPEPRRAEEGVAAADQVNPEPRGFVTPVQAAAEAAITDLRQRARRAREGGDAQTTQPLSPRIERLAGDDPALHGTAAQGLAEVRRGGDQGLPRVADEFPGFPLRHGEGTDAAALARTSGREAGVLPRELPLDDAGRAAAAPRLLPEGEHLRSGHDGGRGGAPAWATETGFRPAPAGERFAAGESAGREALPQVGLADLQRRDLAAAGMGEANRAAVRSAQAEDPARHAVGAGADAAALPQPKTARWALVEADDLKASHDTNLRPLPENPFARQGATRAENEAAVQGIVGKFEPERLAEALDDADGAPIVAHDGVVEAGQRRAIALQRIYQANGQKAENYRQFLRDNAVDFGLAPEQIAGMRKPVLVRLPDEPAPRRAAGYTDREAGGFNEHHTEGRGSLGADRSGLPAGEDVFATVGGGRPASGWAETTRIRGKDGKPATVYRGAATELHPDHFTPQAFGRATERPSAGLGVWFSTTAGDAAKFGKVSRYHLDIRRPKVFKVENLPGFDSIAGATAFRDALRQKGYDGIAVDARHLGGPLHLVAFEPTQVVRRAQADGRLTPTKPPEAGNAAASAQRGVQDMAVGTQNAWAPGSAYTGFINDSHTPATTPASVSRAKPITREAVLAPFLKALGVRLYEGRIRGEKKLGHYRKTLEEVRVKRKSDLEVAAHEIGHLLDDRVPAISSVWRSDKALRAELKSISYDTGKVAEGYAEGVRLFLTQPDVLQAKAPRVYAWLDDFANTHEYGPALRKAQEGMTGWFGQEAINRARSKIGDRRPINEALDGLWDKFRQATVDDLHGVYRMERELKAGKIEPMGAYETARLARASHSIADGAMRYGYPVRKPDGSFAYRGKSLEEILKPVAEKLDDALLYFVGRSARELMTQGREHLFTSGEVDAMLRLRTPEREAAFQEYQAWNKGVLDFAEAQGVINPQARALWQRQSYLPFWRVEQPGNLKGGKPGDWSGVKALTGGTDNLRDILKNMTGNAAMLIDKAVKNEARLKIAELAEQPGGGKFMVKIPPETRQVKVDSQQVIDAVLKAMGIDRAQYVAHGEALPKPARKIIDQLEADMAKSPGFEFAIGGQPPAGKNVVAVLRSGKPEWYEVADPILYRALTAIDRPAQHWIVKWLGLPKRVGQTTITATADFWMANIARDTLMGSVMSRAGFRPILDSLDGMRMRIAKDPLYKEWIANGGGLSSIYLDEARFKAKLEKFYGRQGIDYRTVLDTPDKIMGFIETLGDAFESSTRLGEFKRALGRGENPRHAAYLAREVSTDFAMKGDSKALGFMYDTVMFLRPAVVSIDRLARGVAHDPNKGAIAAKAGSIALASVGLYLLNRDDPRYTDLPDWDRDSNWHFFVGDLHFRYPKIWEIGALASAAERSVEKLMSEDPLGLAKDFARIVANTFSLNLMPQIVAPLYEQATNRNSFTKAPIETPGMENVQPFLRAKPGTSETMKALGMATRDLPEGAQINPARVEALLRGYFNTWALYGLMLSDEAFFGDKLPEKRADELPVVRRFYAQEPARRTRYESEFYDLLGEAKRLRGTLKELDEMNLRGLADEKEKAPLSGEAKPLERAAKNLGAINNEMQAVRRDPALTPAEMRQRLDALTVERNALLKEAVLESKKAQKEKTP